MPFKNLYKILLVEDDEIDILSFKKIAKEEGFLDDLRIFSDGLQAKDYVRNNEGENFCIILDLNLPLVSGIDFLAWLREREEGKTQKIPVIVLTTSNDDKDFTSASQYCISGYVLKSLDTEEHRKNIAAIRSFFNIIKKK